MIFIALGSNLGDRLMMLTTAIEKLKHIGTVVSTSPVYETAPWGNTDQPHFLNQCIALESTIEPHRLMKVIKKLEHQLGRRAGEKWGPREVDIDILFIDNRIIETPNLKVPHPYVHERAFVLVPLREIAADFKHPTRNKTIQQLLTGLDVSGVSAFTNNFS